MVEDPSSGESNGISRRANSTSVRWAPLIEHRSALVRLARSRGAGDQAEDVVHTAIEQVVQRPEIDLSNPLPYLVTTVANLCRDLHARDARRYAAAKHPVFVPRPCDPTDKLLDECEAAAAAAELRKLLSPELMELCLRLAARELTWQQAACERGEPEPKLRTEVRRAYIQVRKLVSRWRSV